jgi:hypothetical protein
MQLSNHMKLLNKINILLVCTVAFTFSAEAQSRKERKKLAEKAKLEAAKPKLTAYEKLFKDKTVSTKKGMITLHKLDGKVYFEFPVKLLNKYMLIGSVVESVSNSNDSFSGEQAKDPLCVYFARVDSTVHMKAAEFNNIIDENDPGLKSAVGKNNIGAIISSFKIMAYSADSSSVVFNATDFFVSGNSAMAPFSPVGGLSGRRTAYKAETSLLNDIMAYDDNVSISSYLSYGITSTFWGFVTEQDRPATILMKRSIVLLPETPSRPRLNDPRIGVFNTGFYKFSGKDDGIKLQYYANRWKLEPKDSVAFSQGKLVEPKQAVVFYIDDQFPTMWVAAIQNGINDWNKAFEKIGFKNAIVAKMYPKNDPNFDPNNIKYNCIKYAPTLTQNAMGPSWVDPRSGEILNASVYIYHGIVDILSQWMFLQTAAVDKNARAVNMPEKLMSGALRYVTAHEIGHCLGFMHNMGASSSFPVDSLRSPEFTQKYGTTPSIMDYARFNFVAQPGDVERGVKLTPPDLGVYDYYAVKWLYSPINEAKTYEEEQPILEKWISEKIKDPMYRYGRQQIYGAIDPNAQTEDLGDDQVKSTQYGIDNLKYIMKNMDTWVDKEDRDYEFRKTTNFAIINIQFYWYLTHVLPNIGGVYMYEKFEGDPFPAYKAVPKETQKKSLLFLLNTLENLSWINHAGDNNDFGNIYGDASNFMRTILFPYFMRYVSNISLSENKSNGNPYTQAEAIKDVFDFVWGDALKGKTSSAEKLSMQKNLVQLLINGSGVLKIKDGIAATALNSPSEEELAFEKFHANALKYKMQESTSLKDDFINSRLKISKDDVSGFGYLPRLSYQSADMSHIYYQWLLESKTILQKLVKTQTGELKSEYEYQLLKINKAMKK